LLITLLGVLIAFSPMIVILNLVVVLKSARPVRNCLILIAGVATPLILVALLALALIDPSQEISLRGIGEKISLPAGINLLFGFWLLFVAFKRLSQRHVAPKPSNLLKMPTSVPEKPSALFIFAFIKSTLSVTNLFAIFVVAKVLITSHSPSIVGFFAFLWVLLIGIMPFLTTLYLYFFKKQSLDQLSKRTEALLAINIQRTLTIVLFVVGAGFTINGLVKIF